MIGGGGTLAGGGAMGQLVNTRTRYHRKKRPATLYKRVLYRQPPYVTCYYGGMTKVGVTDAGSGQITNSTRYWKLKNVQPASGSNSQWPLHMFCLTSRPGWNPATGGPPEYRTVGFYLQQDKTAPNNLSWGELSGLDGDLGGTKDMVVWRSNLHTPNEQLGRASKSLLGNVRVELLLQGTRGYPVTFQIWVMKFVDENLDPQHMFYEQSNAGNDAANQFYSGLIRKDVCNPIMSMPAMVETYGRAVVLCKRNYTIMPDSSTNYDLTAGQIRAKIDLNLNRYLHWDWVEKNPQVSFNELDRSSWKPCYPGYAGTDKAAMCTGLRRPSDRIWLMVKASNFAGKTTDDEDVNNMPSYDMRILCNHTIPGNSY